MVPHSGYSNRANSGVFALRTRAEINFAAIFARVRLVQFVNAATCYFPDKKRIRKSIERRHFAKNPRKSPVLKNIPIYWPGRANEWEKRVTRVFPVAQSSRVPRGTSLDCPVTGEAPASFLGERVIRRFDFPVGNGRKQVLDLKSPSFLRKIRGSSLPLSIAARLT